MSKEKNVSLKVFVFLCRIYMNQTLKGPKEDLKQNYWVTQGENDKNPKSTRKCRESINFASYYIIERNRNKDVAEMFRGEEASTSQGMENVFSIKVPVIEKPKPMYLL